MANEVVEQSQGQEETQQGAGSRSKLVQRLLTAGANLPAFVTDLVTAQAVTVAGINGIALTKLDVLDGIDELNICIGYDINGARYDYLPAASELQAAAQEVPADDA